MKECDDTYMGGLLYMRYSARGKYQSFVEKTVIVIAMLLVADVSKACESGSVHLH